MYLNIDNFRSIIINKNLNFNLLGKQHNEKRTNDLVDLSFLIPAEVLQHNKIPS